MKLGHKRLGDYIQLVDERNRNLEVTNLLGISVTKNFIPSVANIVGTDMANYKIVRKNHFACSIMQVRRDKKMPVALYLEDKPSIISQAYPIFQVIDASVLLPEYLMMWFTRSEFDREACFLAVGGVRGSLEWEDFLNMELPIPSPEKQKELIKEYEAIENRIQLNKKLCATLEETAQTIYKHWFEDFEFPDENGKPYQSSGGEMVECEELGKEIPKGWRVEMLKDNCKLITKGTTPSNMSSIQNNNFNTKYIKGESLSDNHNFDTSKVSFIEEKTHKTLNRSQLQEFDICYSIAGTLGKFSIVDKIILPANTNQAIAIIRIDERKINKFFIFGLFFSGYQKAYYDFNIQQAVQANLSLETISTLPILIPNKEIENSFSKIVENIFNKHLNLVHATHKLEELKSLLLGKMAVEV